MTQQAVAVRSSVAGLFHRVAAILEQARSRAIRAVNLDMVRAYWLIGHEVVEHEQGGRTRAAYGESVLEELSRRLTSQFGRGFDVRNLRSMRQFYLAFPAGKRYAVRTESSGLAKPAFPRAESICAASMPRFRPEISWSHYRLLLSVEDPRARAWYLNEAADQQWSTRQLDRQVSTLYYERLLASRDDAPVRREARTKLAAVAPERFIRDPYVLDFLGLRDYPALRESTVEQATIESLQAFLLELGKGFSFVARQKRLRFEEEDFYVDLVFYNYMLRCFVLVDLKVGKLTHQDIGQMDGYVRLFDAHARPPGDNPTIGLILCSQKNDAIAKYSVLSEGRQIFAAKYLKYLPTEDALRRELKRGRHALERRRPTAARAAAARPAPPPRPRRPSTAGRR